MTVKCVKQQVEEEGILFLLSSCDDVLNLKTYIYLLYSEGFIFTA